MPESMYPLVEAAAKYCWGKNGQEVFKSYFDKHAPLFVDAPLKEQGGEQDLEYYALFQDYLKLYEETISGYIESLGESVTEFYHQLQDVQEDTTLVKQDKKLVHFVNYMIGCTDYPAFYKMMVRAAKKYNKGLMSEAKASARKAAATSKAGGDDVGLSNLGNEFAADEKTSGSGEVDTPSKGEGKNTSDADSHSKGAGGESKISSYADSK